MSNDSPAPQRRVDSLTTKPRVGGGRESSQRQSQPVGLAQGLAAEREGCRPDLVTLCLVRVSRWSNPFLLLISGPNWLKSHRVLTAEPNSPEFQKENFYLLIL